jgi:hypothetical protein
LKKVHDATCSTEKPKTKPITIRNSGFDSTGNKRRYAKYKKQKAE